MNFQQFISRYYISRYNGMYVYDRNIGTDHHSQLACNGKIDFT